MAGEGTSAIQVILLGKGLNSGSWAPVCSLLEKKGIGFTISGNHNELRKGPDLGIILGYDRIIPSEVLARPRLGFILFHSSDLPRGRGWAPIYNTVTANLPLTQTLLFASEEVDAGPVIAKATYPLEGNEMEAEVRKFDDGLTLALLDDVLDPLLKGKVQGIEQDHSQATWWRRRVPEDSEVRLEASISESFDHIRGLPRSAPVVFSHRGRRFKVMIEPMDPGKTFDPENVRIQRFF